MSNKFPSVRRMWQTSAAERLAAPFPNPEARSWISTILHWLSAVAFIRQPRSQSISCSPNLGYHNSIFCKHDATVRQSWWSLLAYCCSQEPPSGREWMLEILQKNGRNGFMKQPCSINLVWHCVTFCKHRLNLDCLFIGLQQSQCQFFIASWFLLHGKHGADIERCHNKSPWKPQTKKSNGNFTVKGMSMSCLDRVRKTNFGYRKFTTKSHSNPSLIHNSHIDPDDVRAGFWLPTQ